MKKNWIFQNISRMLYRFLMRLFFDRELMTQGVKGGRLHILVPRWDGKLGDSIVSSFFLREAIRILDARVTVVTVPELAQMHSLDFGVDQVFTSETNPKIYELLMLAHRIRRVDVVVHLVGRIQPAEILFFRLLRPSKIYSFDDELNCVNRKMGSEATLLDITERYEYVLTDLGATGINNRYIVPLPDKGQLSPHCIDILFNPYASREDKSLSFEKSKNLVTMIADEYPEKKIGILCSPKTLPNSKALMIAIRRENVFVVHGLASLKNLADVINRAGVVVSVDTAIVHMSVGLNKNLVAVYPSTGDSKNPWLPPKSPNTRVVFSHHCIEKYRLTGRKNLNLFSNTDVLEKIRELLKNDSKPITILKARTVSGIGAAHKNLKRQLPLIARNFPEISVCHLGTINLEFTQAFEVIEPDHRTEPLAWTPSGQTKEVFDFVRIELEFNSRPRTPAWLYIAHNSPHRETPKIHEVIAPYISVDKDKECKIYIRANAIS